MEKNSLKTIIRMAENGVGVNKTNKKMESAKGNYNFKGIPNDLTAKRIAKSTKKKYNLSKEELAAAVVKNQDRLCSELLHAVDNNGKGKKKSSLKNKEDIVDFFENGKVCKAFKNAWDGLEKRTKNILYFVLGEIWMDAKYRDSIDEDVMKFLKKKFRADYQDNFKIVAKITDLDKKSDQLMRLLLGGFVFKGCKGKLAGRRIRLFFNSIVEVELSSKNVKKIIETVYPHHRASVALTLLKDGRVSKSANKETMANLNVAITKIFDKMDTDSAKDILKKIFKQITESNGKFRMRFDIYDVACENKFKKVKKIVGKEIEKGHYPIKKEK